MGEHGEVGFEAPAWLIEDGDGRKVCWLAGVLFIFFFRVIKPTFLSRRAFSRWYFFCLWTFGAGRWSTLLPLY